MKYPWFFFVPLVVASAALTQSPAPTPPATRTADAGPRRFQASYPMPYEPMSVTEISAVLERVRSYLDAVTPAKLVERDTQREIADPAAAGENVTLARGDFLLVSYEWGVTYAGMLHAAEATGDRRYADYAATRLKFIADSAPHFPQRATATPPAPVPSGPRPAALLFRSVNAPRSLDDSGAMAAAFIKAARAGLHPDALRPFIDRYLTWISSGQMRLSDGTLARNRPLHNALWLDDLYMSVPALAQMGALTGDRRYFDDAAKQIVQFHQRMFVKEKRLFMHGWIQDMEPHPAFHWARANGWAIVATAELLSVLPEDHPQRAAVIAIYRDHARGLAACQGGAGLWHQLLDRVDSYPETSATAMFVYALARGINRGWLDRLAYGPAVSLGWNAVTKQINEHGQVENTCVGTGMGFDPAFYYHRPVSPYAAHGYGPVLLAGAEMITLRQGKGIQANVNDASVQFAPSPSRH
ncbi:MAG TPA: glycoside hydrolase family 88 protein [Opitutaceae bacterium]